MTPPVPVRDGHPAECCVTTTPAGEWTLAWLSGTRKQAFGEPFRDVRRACRESARINAELVAQS